MAKGKTEKSESFEDRQARLEAIVARLESGESTLEESLRLYEEGIQLHAACAKQLAEAKLKIEELSAAAAAAGAKLEKTLEEEEE